jgi:NAD(P)-dependent dehydrogenase (short-subunit alcohol dehydrogenase family)
MNEKVALISGGSKGIGFGIAKAFASRGITVILVARNRDDLTAAKLNLERNGSAVHTVVADLTNPAAFDDIKKYVEHHFPKLDFLINNAGDFKQLPTLGRETPAHLAQDMQQLFLINASAPAALSQVLLTSLLRADNPKQLDVLSSAALEIFPLNNPYGPTKAAHERLSLSVVVDSKNRVHTCRIYPSNELLIKLVKKPCKCYLMILQLICI